MTSSPDVAANVTEWHRQARAALQAQRNIDAVALWRRIVGVAPDDLAANAGLGRWALHQGDLDGAQAHLARVARADSSNPRHWIDLALVCQKRRDDPGEEDALFQALKAAPQDLLALLMRGALLERTGRAAAAVDAYIAATLVAPPLDRVSPDLRAPLAHAQACRQAHERRLAEHMDTALVDAYAKHAGEDLRRFRLSMDILLGRKRRFDAQPMRYFVPQLAPVEFFDRSLFPWLDAIEAGTAAIRDEFLAVLRDDAGFTPYIEYGPDEPVEQWAELNHSPRWSCYHLWKGGVAVPEHVARCPQTMRLLAGSPRPDQPGRTPVALFSLLKPQTAIPPHVGASNARLLCHLPLIIPPHCSFRVGNTVREWEPGRAWVFDDTIEHEARNDSDELRVILIWDIWHPGLSDAERGMITAMNGALNAFAGADHSFGA
jgi:aspartate beta-hydroxylase